MASKRGRPRKTGLDWFPFELGLLTDRKLRRAKQRFGPAAALTYLALLTLIYQDKGYYLDYCESEREDVALDVSDLISGPDPLAAGEIQAIIEELVERELFNKACFAAGVLTSRRIQKTYYNAVSERKSANINWDIWLLTEADMREISQVGPILKLYLQEHGKLEIENNQTENSQSKTKENTANQTTIQNKTTNHIIPNNLTEDADVENGEEISVMPPSGISGAVAPHDNGFQKIADFWNFHVAQVSDLATVRDADHWSRKREKQVRALVESEGEANVFGAFDQVAASDFLTGRSGKWRCDFDWVIQPDNFQKIVEGRYSNAQTVEPKGTFYDRLARGEI